MTVSDPSEPGGDEARERWEWLSTEPDGYARTLLGGGFAGGTPILVCDRCAGLVWDAKAAVTIHDRFHGVSK